jgi:hypothetical protein
MPFFHDLPCLWDALTMIKRAEGRTVRIDAGRLPIPEEWVEPCRLANEALKFIQGQVVAELIPEDQIDNEVVDADDDAFEYVCKGDSTMLPLLLQTVPHAPMLTRVLENIDEIFDGANPN